ncbi:hypothetical protein BDF14DRAFT_1796920 [Spinellus fusiger]|nr:hypothetical protein BDF14DRAFT_1796920 [Spinellus fusiger]
MANKSSLPLQFQLLYHWDSNAHSHTSVSGQRTCMYPVFQCQLNAVPIYRLIDFHLKGHYISAGQLWRACGLTLMEGLFLFYSNTSSATTTSVDYHIDFNQSHFPFCDVWVTCERASVMAHHFGVETQLAYLLSNELDMVYSSDHPLRNELIHNWKLESIPNSAYSSQALLATSFDHVHVFSDKRKIRTQISHSRLPGMVMKDPLENGLVHWQVDAHEHYIQQGGYVKSHASLQETLPISTIAMPHWKDTCKPKEEPCLCHGSPSTAIHVWDIFQGLLCDLQTLCKEISSGPITLKESRVFPETMTVGSLVFNRLHLGEQGHLQVMYLSMMTEQLQKHIHILAETLQQKKEVSLSGHDSIPKSNDPKDQEDQQSYFISTSSPLSSTVDRQMLLHDRMDFLEQTLHSMRCRLQKKVECILAEQQNLEQKVGTLELLRVKSKNSRQKERFWVLFFILFVSLGLWVHSKSTHE